MSKQVINNQVFDTSEIQKREVVNNVLIEPATLIGAVNKDEKAKTKTKSKTVKPRRKKTV
jgi:hypothetical protein